MPTPFFSIAIPTKGRSFIVGDAIESVLRQNFPDFEVIVADNDDGNVTHEVVSRFKDPRVRYHRTGGLCMPDNWESAGRQAQGEYLLMLEDKQALHGGALERLHALIEKHQPDTLKWKADTLNDITNLTWVEEPGGTGEVRFMPSNEVLRTFLSATRQDTWQVFPIAHMSAFSRKLRKAMLDSPVGRICPPANPSDGAGILAMTYGPGVFLIDSSLVAMSRKHSAGASFEQKTALGKQFMTEIGGPSRLWSHTPIQAPISAAMVINDYVELRNAIGAPLEDFPPDWVNYYVESWRNVVGLENDGVNMTDEYEAIDAALSKETPEMQKQVWAAIEQREGPPAKSRRKNRIKAFRRRTGLLALEHNWKLFLRRLAGRRHINRFHRPLEYVIWVDQQASRA